MTSFVQKLDKASLNYFNDVCHKPFAQQAVAFLNAYWAEIKDQAEFIFSVAWERIRYADMHAKGISLIFKYDEGIDLDFDIALYFYEILCKFMEEPKNAKWKSYKMSQPTMMTAIKRKKELKDKVDVNFDGRVSFLEYLLYQYRSVANPADFCTRSMAMDDEHPEIRKARLALEEASKAIRAYEERKKKLEDQSKLPGVKGLNAKHLLAQLEASPLFEAINKTLITAEAAVRIATKKFGGIKSKDGSVQSSSASGAVWWMNRDLTEKKRLYGRKKK